MKPPTIPNVEPLSTEGSRRAFSFAMLNTLGLALGLIVTSTLAWGVVGTCVSAVLGAAAAAHLFKELKAEKRQLERLSTEASEALEHGKTKSRFLASMSHEIRNPMNGVQGMVEVLLESELNSDQRECAETLKRSAQGLMLILNDILDFSKIEAGTLELDRSEIKSLEWVESVAELHFRTAFDKGVEFAYHLDASVPELILGDGLRLRQVLTNLVSNAIKFTSEGSVLIEGMAVERDGAPYLRFQVSDTGIGIADESRRLLFQPFSQATIQTAEKFGGTGLGLAISRELVGLMNGRMDVDSVLGKGSTFWFELPLEAASETGLTAPALDDHDVLIVDDHDIRVDVIRRTLESWGMRVRVASDLETALATLTESRKGSKSIKLTIVDLDVAEGVGREVANRIKTDQALRSTQLVAINVLGRSLRPGSLARAGFDAWLTKPISPTKLRAALTHLVAEHCEHTLVDEVTARELESEEILLDETILDVLLVEDNVVNQRVATFLLQREGCRVDVAADGEQAVEAFLQGGYDLIFMDCQMPVMNGFQATREIRSSSSGQHVPIVAMTAQAMPGDRERCLAEGMNDYLCKPVQTEELKRVIAQWGDVISTEQVPGALPTQMNNMDDREVLDAAVIESLRELGGEDDPELLSELIGLFLVDTPKRIEELMTAVEESDVRGMEQAAHALKSSAANLGALQLSELFRSIETAGRSEQLEEAMPFVERCQSDFDMVQDALRSLI